MATAAAGGRVGITTKQTQPTPLTDEMLDALIANLPPPPMKLVDTRRNMRTYLPFAGQLKFDTPVYF